MNLRDAAIALLCVGLIGVSTARGQSPWFVSYEKALTAQEEGDWKSSIQYLKEAIAAKGVEKLKAKTYGLRFVNYLPYFHLGLAHYHLKDKRQALENLDVSLRQGAIAESPEDLERLQALRAELSGVAAKQPTDVEKRPPPAVETPGGEIAGGLPWYVNYETALEYIESGDWLQATENLKLALAANGIPRRYARTYGMWFVTYIPYYYLGVAYYNQGLWQLAVRYFETAERLGEVKDLEPESSTLQRMLTEARRRNVPLGGRAVSEQLRETLNREIAEAVRLFNQQSYTEAEAKFSGVLQLDPYNSVAKNYMARIARFPRDTAGESPVNKDFSSGMVQLLKGNHERAIRLFRAAEGEMGQDVELHVYLGVAYCLRYRSSGKKDASAVRTAREEFRRALAIDPGYKLDATLFSKDVIDVFNTVKRAAKK
ncbi:MAG: hypothetical protein AB1428_09890 [Bacteroidota bacterium]